VHSSSFSSSDNALKRFYGIQLELPFAVLGVKSVETSDAMVQVTFEEYCNGVNRLFFPRLGEPPLFFSSPKFPVPF